MKKLNLLVSLLLLIFSEVAFTQNIFQLEEKILFQNHLQYLMRASGKPVSDNPSLAIFKFLISNEDRVMTLANSPELFAYLEKEIVRPLCQSPTGKRICEEFHIRQNGYDGSVNNSVKSVLQRLVLVESHNLLLSVDSFAYFGEAWIFIQPNHVTKEHLLRMISHELFQLVDIKNLIHIDPRIRELYLTDETDCKALSALRNEEFRLTTSAVRSFIVEDRIVREVLNRQGGYGLEKLSCIERINKVLSQVQSIPDGFSTFGMGLEHVKIRDPENKCLTLTGPVSFADALRFSQNVSLMDSEKGQRISACDFLVTPSLIGSWSQPLAPKSFMQGPRPRIGDP